MDNAANNDPLGPKSVFGSNWIKKKSRYEDDDLSLTPDDSSFFSLRFGAQRSKPNESMYDRINKELGLSVESSKGNVTPELNIAPASKDRDGNSTQILLGPSGIVLERNRRQQSSTSVSVISSSDDVPKILVPATILERKEESAGAIGGHDSPENSSVAHQDVETLVSKVRGGRPTRKISMNLADTIDRKFLEGVQDLKLEAPQTAEQVRPLCSVLPNVPTDVSSTLIDSIPVVSAIRDRRRKTSAPPSLNPMKASNFFFTGGLFSTVATTSASTMASSEAPASLMQQQEAPGVISEMKPSALSQPTSPLKQLETQGNMEANYTLAQTTSLMEERASEAAALEPKGKMGKRRPKASALREMNFWAPQSM